MHNRKEVIENLKTFEEMRQEILERYPEGEEREVEFAKLLEESVEINIKKVPEEVIELTDAEGYDKLTLGVFTPAEIGGSYCHNAYTCNLTKKQITA